MQMSTWLVDVVQLGLSAVKHQEDAGHTPIVLEAESVLGGKVTT